MADDAHEQIHVGASPARCFALGDRVRGVSGLDQRREAGDGARRATPPGRGTRVEYHVAGLGRRVRYVLDYDFTDAPRAFSWSLVEGDLLRALDGRYAFAPTATAPTSTTRCGSISPSRCRGWSSGGRRA